MSNKEMTTEKRLKVRLYLSLLVYTVVGYGLTLIVSSITIGKSRGAIWMK